MFTILSCSCFVRVMYEKLFFSGRYWSDSVHSGGIHRNRSFYSGGSHRNGSVYSGDSHRNRNYHSSGIQQSVNVNSGGTHRISKEELAENGRQYRYLLNIFAKGNFSVEEIKKYSYMNDWIMTVTDKKPKS